MVCLWDNMVFLASVVRSTPFDEDGSMLKARCTDEHQALQHAERKVNGRSRVCYLLLVMFAKPDP